ncbi:MAG: glycosylase [Saprospiraceae bacterium]
MLFNWTKLGRVFDPTAVKDRYFINEFAQAPHVLIFDDFIRVYFSCRPPADEHGQYVSYSSWLDLDRKDLFKVLRIAEHPILPLGELGTFDEFGTYPVSVVRHGNEMRAYYAGWTRCESVPFNVAIGMAVSHDEGQTFERIGPGPILSYSHDEPFILSGPKIRRFNDKWYLFYIAGKKWIMDNGRPEPVYRIRLAISDDGINFQKVERDLIETKLEADEAQASPDVFFRDGRYHMFFCYRYSTGYRSRERGYRIGYAWSEDLLNWHRDDAQTNIDISEDGFDNEMVSYPHVFELDGETYMFYLGNGVGRFGFGAARLER